MKVIDNAKKGAFKHIIKGITKASDKTLEKIIDGLLLLTPKEHKEVMTGIKKSIHDKDAFYKLFKRMVNECNPNIKDAFFVNFIAQSLLINENIKRKIRAQGSFAPTTILVSPTMRCNLECTGCYAARYSMKDDMSYKLFDDILTQAEKMGVSFFTILGGEPLVYKDLFKIFKKHKDSFFQFFTNSTLVNQKVVNKIVKNGNAIPMISIEGWEKETDERRGKGTYKKILRAMDLMKKAGIPFGVSVAVTSKNANIISSDKFIRFIVERGAFFSWWFLYMPIGREPDLDLMPTPKQRKMMYERGIDIRKKYPMFLVDFWNDAPFVGGCIAGKEYVHINPKGDVEPCIFTHYAADNIKDKPLMEVMKSDYFRALRSKQPYNDNLFMPCMWIDNPEVARDLHKKYGVYPTHPDAQFIIANEKTKKHLDRYSKEVEVVFRDVWAGHCKNCK